jgi:hypothetical protein
MFGEFAELKRSIKDAFPTIEVIVLSECCFVITLALARWLAILFLLV